jgi:hypothetical protein
MPNLLGFEQRYNLWLADVAKWAKYHNITLDQAMSILFNDNKEITSRELITWAESSEFYYHFIKHNN